MDYLQNTRNIVLGLVHKIKLYSVLTTQPHPQKNEVYGYHVMGDVIL